jgi:AcrR family transcriptional regulator
MSAAKKLLKENDYEDVSVGAILAESDLSTRSFYRHFASKDELLIAMHRSNAEKVGQRLREGVDAAASPREALEAWVDEALRLHFDARAAQLVAVFDSASARRAVGYEEATRVAVELMVDPLRDVLEAGRASGEFPLAHPEQDVLSIHALVRNASRSGLLRTRADARDHVLRFALAGLGVR